MGYDAFSRQRPDMWTLRLQRIYLFRKYFRAPPSGIRGERLTSNSPCLAPTEQVKHKGAPHCTASHLLASTAVMVPVGCPTKRPRPDSRGSSKLHLATDSRMPRAEQLPARGTRPARARTAVRRVRPVLLGLMGFATICEPIGNLIDDRAGTWTSSGRCARVVVTTWGCWALPGWPFMTWSRRSFEPWAYGAQQMIVYAVRNPTHIFSFALAQQIPGPSLQGVPRRTPADGD